MGCLFRGHPRLANLGNADVFLNVKHFQVFVTFFYISKAFKKILAIATSSFSY